MDRRAHRIIIPQFQLTETADRTDVSASVQRLQDGNEYRHRPKYIEKETDRIDGKPNWVKAQFDKLPIVIKSNGEPWDEVNCWIFSYLESKPYPNMETAMGMASDLVAYCQFLDEYSLDYLEFPPFKLRRPTYRYNGHLRAKVNLRELNASTAIRRMSRVVSFYRWMIQNKIFNPANPPWEEKVAYIPTSTHYGEKLTLKVNTTDVSLKIPKAPDPFDETIPDGGRLRPLPQNEQEWLLDALFSLNHTESTLIHLLALATGARIQTVLTFRLRHVMAEHTGSKSVRILVGPGTGIATKNNKKMTLVVPAWLYKALHVYAHSKRAIERRNKNIRGSNDNQYLFLSPSGAVLYEDKFDNSTRDTARRHIKNGQNVRQYIKKYIIPYIRKQYAASFSYRFHDLRATFGMNLVDANRNLVDEGKMTITQLLNLAMDRLGHSSLKTTEHYLKYRERIKSAHITQDNWEARLETLAARMMESLNG